MTYLLPGHIMMPADSVHNTIEWFVRRRTICPSEWPTIIFNAGTYPSGYNCFEIGHSEFENWNLNWKIYV